MPGAKEDESGIRGFVSIGGTGEESIVRRRPTQHPFAAMIQIKDAVTGQELTTVQSTTDGHFYVALPPGEYLLEPASPRPFVPPYAEPQQVTVHQGEITEVAISYESGVR